MQQAGESTSGGSGNSGVPIPSTCSFSADTDVATPDGPVDISDIELGDEVLAYNEDTGEVGTYPVTALYVHLDPVIVELTIDRETITTTPEHPFYTEDGVWVDAGDLVVGEEIRQLDGSYGTVRAVEISHEQQWMYNLTVDEAHTYFVDGGWLVHNVCTFNQVDYGSTSLSQMAVNYRISKPYKLHKDVGVVVYVDSTGAKKTVVWNADTTGEEDTGFNGHFERRIWKKLQSEGVNPENVLEMYSELEPCQTPTPAAGCAAFLRRTFPNLKVTYTFEYGDAASRKRGREEWIKVIDALPYPTSP